MKKKRIRVTLKVLKKHNACPDAIERFKKENHEGQDVWEIINILEKEKDSNNYIWWLFEKYKLSGICQGWWENGNKCHEATFIKGKFHDRCRGWYDNGNT